MNIVKRCSLKMRLVLDVLHIILFNVIHLGMEISAIHIKDEDKRKLSSYRVGEFSWYIIIQIFGFLSPLILLVRVLGLRPPKSILRSYYGIGGLIIAITAGSITIMSFMDQKKAIDCPDASGDCSCCDMSPKKFQYEIIILAITLVNCSMFAYSFFLTYIREPIGIGDDKSMELNKINSRQVGSSGQNDVTNVDATACDSVHVESPRDKDNNVVIS